VYREGFTFVLLPLSSCALSPVKLLLLETFLELLLWSSFQCHHYIFWMSSLLEIFVHLRKTLFLETTRSHLEPNMGNRVGVPFQYLISVPETAWQRVSCDMEHCHGRESNLWVKVQAFITVSLSKFNCTAIVLTLKCLSECTGFHTFSTFLLILWDLGWPLLSSCFTF